MTRTKFGCERTVCDCKECTTYCHFLPGFLLPCDLETIQQKLSLDDANLKVWAMTYLRASQGALVVYQGDMMRIPTLVPALTDKGCIFLKEKRCSIHEFSPFGCAFFDDHISERTANKLSQHGLKEVMDDMEADGKYHQIWKMLLTLGLEDLPPERKRIQLEMYENANK